MTTTKTADAGETDFDHIDAIWDQILLREKLIHEGSWFSAYHPAAVDAVSRRYQFWATECRSDADLEALINRPRVEMTLDFLNLAQEVMNNFAHNQAGGVRDVMASTVAWNKVISLKWSERNIMMDYIRHHTAMRNPLLPYPELRDRPQPCATPYGNVTIQILQSDDYACAWIQELNHNRSGRQRCFKLVQDRSMPRPAREAAARQLASEVAKNWYA